MRSFKSLSEKEILALAVALEEEDAKIYGDFVDGLRASYPATADMFTAMRKEEEGHRHRLTELFRQRFGEHIPHVRREDVKGYIQRRPTWLKRPLRPEIARKQAALMELETRRYYERALSQTNDAGIRQLLGDLAAEEREHQST